MSARESPPRRPRRGGGLAISTLRTASKLESVQGGSARLSELARDQEQNELICETLLAGIKGGKYARVMVSACNLEHAHKLADLCSRRGIGARVLHQDAGSEHSKFDLLTEFKSSASEVSIRVATPTDGIEVPGADAVFLTQPTAGEVVRSHGVGSGALRIRGRKHEFWIVELGHSSTRHSDKPFHARELLTDPAPPTTDRISRAAKVHKPAPKHPKFLRLVAPRDLAGLTYVEDQTFGIEVEFTSPLGSPDSTGVVYPTAKWREVALTILRAIESVASVPVDRLPRNYHEVVDTGKWRVEFDRSAGWEVVSPVLRNQRGFTELANVLGALGALLRKSDDLHINYRTGLHVTLGSGFTDDEQVRGLVRLGQVLEPGLFTLVSPSRLYDFHHGHYALQRHNKYCRPLRQLESNVEQLGLASFQKANPFIRYRTVNLSHVGRDDQRIEIRLHNGTTDYPVVLAWISLWMTLFNRTRLQWPLHGSTQPIFPGGDIVIAPEQARAEDIFALLDKVSVELDPVLRTSLARRRSGLLTRWKKVLPRRVQSWRRWW